MSKEGYNTKSKEELLKTLSEKQVELGKLNFVKGDPSQKINTSSIKNLRREIARVQTLLNQLSK
ncbi:MAG: Ribosomal protein [Candidatus Parcubacteria bacterium]|jgi:ribosomal protein L29